MFFKYCFWTLTIGSKWQYGNPYLGFRNTGNGEQIGHVSPESALKGRWSWQELPVMTYRFRVQFSCVGNIRCYWFQVIAQHIQPFCQIWTFENTHEKNRYYFQFCISDINLYLLIIATIRTWEKWTLHTFWPLYIRSNNPVLIGSCYSWFVVQRIEI